MPHFTLQVDPIGPLLNVKFAISQPRWEALTEAGETPPESPTVKGLVDTGASCTSVDPSVVSALRLSPTGVGALVTAGNTVAMTVNQYDVGVAIFSSPNEAPLVIPLLSVAELPLANQGFEALIGRDVLSRCVLVYNGKVDQYTLAF